MVRCMAATNPDATSATTRFRLEVFDRAMEAKGIVSESAKAEFAGVDRATLWRWRNGVMIPSRDTLAFLGDRLELAVDDLIERVAA